MSGVGKFKMTDALRGHQPTELPGVGGRSKKALKGKAKPSKDLVAEQVREEQEAARARNDSASNRGHMVDIGRGNQQAGRQGGK